MRNSESIGFFKGKVLRFILPKPKSIYNCHNPKGIRLITRLRPGLSHLREHKFKHSFQDCLNSLCLCGNDVETSSHFLLHCPTYSNERMTFLNKIKKINYGILELSDTIMTKALLFGDSLLSYSTNTLILNSKIDYVIATKRFDDPLLLNYLVTVNFFTFKCVNVYYRKKKKKKFCLHRFLPLR